jgi:hypothetical protein
MTHEDGQAQVEGSENQSDIKTTEQADVVNKRILEESIRNKKKAQELQAKLDEVDKAQAEKAGNIQKLLELERKEKEKLQAELFNTKKQNVDVNLRAVFMEYGDRFANLDDMLNQPKHRDILKLAVNEETGEIDKKIVERYIDEVLTDKPHQRKQVTNPGAMTKKPGIITGKSISSMSRDELKEYMRQKYK